MKKKMQRNTEFEKEIKEQNKKKIKRVIMRK